MFTSNDAHLIVMPQSQTQLFTLNRSLPGEKQNSEEEERENRIEDGCADGQAGDSNTDNTFKRKESNQLLSDQKAFADMEQKLKSIKTEPQSPPRNIYGMCPLKIGPCGPQFIWHL